MSSIILPEPDAVPPSPSTPQGARFSGMGSWPNVAAREAVRTVRDLMVRDGGVPYLPEVPARGPGADMVGRGAGLLVELPTELTPDGWRIAPGRGREMRRAHSYWREDLDQLAEAYEGYTGPLKTQIIGPWTLASSLELPRGEKVLSDLGAVRDLVQSLRAGIAEHVAGLKRLVPGADVIVQLDEPSLVAVLDGQLRSASKLRRLPPIDAGLVQDTLRNSMEDLHRLGVGTLIHSCAPGVDVELLAKTGVKAIALDTSLITHKQFDALGSALDAGLTLWAGCVPTTTDVRHPASVVARLRELLSRVGFASDIVDQLVITPACGLAFADVDAAVAITRLCADVASMLNDER